MKEKIIPEIRQALRDCTGESVRKSSIHYFKEGKEALVYGVRTGEVNKIAKAFYNQIKDCPKQEIFAELPI